MNEIEDRRICVMVNLNSIETIPNVVFYNKFGKIMEPQDLQKQIKAYLLLAMAQKSKRIQKSKICIDKADLESTNKFWINQIKSNGSFQVSDIQ